MSAGSILHCGRFIRPRHADLAAWMAAYDRVPRGCDAWHYVVRRQDFFARAAPRFAVAKLRIGRPIGSFLLEPKPDVDSLACNPELALASQPTTEVLASTAFERECVLFFAESVQLFGVPKSVGQIYGLLYATPAPLGFADIVERLAISKGSASQGLQLLRSLGAIVEAGANGGVGSARGVTYEPELSLRQLITGVLRERIAPMASTGADRLKRLKALAEQAPANTKFYLGRAKQLETWRKRFTTVMPLLTALLGPKKKKR